jgi:hypothetical protein
LLIPYLNVGNYFGIEPNQWLVEEGVRREIGEALLQIKRPRFFYSSSPEALIQAGVSIDFALAQSIFSHCGLDLISHWLSGISQLLTPTGALLATFLPCQKDSLLTGWNYPDCVSFRPATLARLAAEANLSFEILDWKHPRQTWALFAKPGFDVSWFRNKPLSWNTRLEGLPSQKKEGTPLGVNLGNSLHPQGHVYDQDGMHEPAPRLLLEVCPVCGEHRFTTKRILWPELIDRWNLSAEEVDHINLQQGFSCANCKNNLRSMTLAAAVKSAFSFGGNFKDFCCAIR